ncbi:MAG: hypothetical protein B6U87_02705 [Candidatus Aenigmarchaeota archaeon ex4484_52]|nr:MAG: hypothetical protein B6U87_02705 [Candidatus Aenigmarchaeota archaeon ex4484_52]
MKKILYLLILSIVLSSPVFGATEEPIDCKWFNKTYDCESKGYVGIVSFERENRSAIFKFNSTMNYSLCCNESYLVENYKKENYGIIAMEDYWKKPLFCNEKSQEHCNYPYIYIESDGTCDRGKINISMGKNNPIGTGGSTLTGTINDFFRPYTICIPPKKTEQVKSYINLTGPKCGENHTKLFVLANKSRSLLYKNEIPSHPGEGYAVCAYLVADTTPPEITILSPKPITYIEPNIDIRVHTNEQVKNCNYSINGANFGVLGQSLLDNHIWQKTLNFKETGTYDVSVECTDAVDLKSSKQVEFKRDVGELGIFDESDITIRLSEEKIIPVFLNNLYSYNVVYHLQIRHSTDSQKIPLTNFGWFDGHRSDLNRTDLYVTIAPGKSQTISFIQYGGVEGEGQLILNVSANKELIIENAKKNITIISSANKNFFAPSPDIQTTGFIFVVLTSTIMMFLKL